MAGIASPIPEIDNTHIRQLPANRPIRAKRVVKLSDDFGILVEAENGALYSTGRVARHIFIVGEEAAPGTVWGAILDALASLGRISRADVTTHRKIVADRNNKLRARQDADMIRRICDERGWAMPAGIAMEHVSKRG